MDADKSDLQAPTPLDRRAKLTMSRHFLHKMLQPLLLSPLPKLAWPKEISANGTHYECGYAEEGQHSGLTFNTAHNIALLRKQCNLNCPEVTGLQI
jgi:hypothetical protein